MAKSVILGYRKYHSIEVVGDDLIIWGGYQVGLPSVHDDEKKRSITTKLDMLNLPTMEWSNVSTTNTPPAGAIDYSTTTIGEKMFVFGGRCDSRCIHNDLYQLNTNNKIWGSIPCTNRPMEKDSCGFISYSYQGCDYLLALGGEGWKRPPPEPQPHSLYMCDRFGYYFTNEVHIMNITTSPGKWVSPTVTGDRPPPTSRFTLNQLPNDRSKAVLFGGKIVTETNRSNYSNDVYILSLTDDKVNFNRLSPQPGSLWPKARKNHSSTVVAHGTKDYLLIIGGWRDGSRLADCWLLNITTKRWCQIDLPESVCKRRYHSVSSVAMNANTQWIIVAGGDGVRGADVTMIVQLAYCLNEWVVNGVWNSTQVDSILSAKRAIVQESGGNGGSSQEIQQLRQQLRDAQHQLQQQEDVVRRLTTNNTQLQTRLQQKDNDLQQKDNDLQQKDNDLQQKDNDLQQILANNERLENVIQQKDDNIQQKNGELQQLTLQIEALRSDIAVKDDIIQRNDTTIAEQQREITRYRDNPHWAIQKEEVEITGQVLGKGGWGEVKVGIFRGKRVAVKCLYEAIISPHYLQLFSREMDIASCVRHPNLLQFIGATRVGDLIIVTELMPTSLRSELEKSHMNRLQIISIATDVASGLNYLHCWRPLPILHRDVSSANVLLEPSNNSQWKAKLSDYGSVNLVENIKTANPGSPVYSAPEANNPAHHSPAMDIYSFGILMTEMATGQFPPSVSHEKEALIRLVKWAAVRDLIVNCTISKFESRPLTSIVLEQLREMALDN